KVVGWAMAGNYKTPLITAAIEMAARNADLPVGAIFHSDRGSNYTSAEFAGVLEGLGIRQSVGRTGPSTRRGGKHGMILRGTLRSAIIGSVFTRHSVTGLRKRPTTST